MVILQGVLIVGKIADIGMSIPCMAVGVRKSSDFCLFYAFLLFHVKFVLIHRFQSNSYTLNG